MPPPPVPSPKPGLPPPIVSPEPPPVEAFAAAFVAAALSAAALAAEGSTLLISVFLSGLGLASRLGLSTGNRSEEAGAGVCWSFWSAARSRRSWGLTSVGASVSWGFVEAAMPPPPPEPPFPPPPAPPKVT